MKNILRSIIIATAIATTLPACTSEEGFSNYVILPQRENQEPESEAESVYEIPNDLIVHIFMDVKGTGWRALSFDDAQEGILTDTVGGGHVTLGANASFTQNNDGRIDIGSLEGGRRHFLVACDRESGSYAWRDLNTVGDAGTIFLSLIFRPWRLRNSETESYTELAWTMINQIREPVDPVNPTDPEDPE